MNFPKDFIDRVSADGFLGAELLTALNTEPPVSIRLNPHKTKPVLAFSDPIKWCLNAWYLEARPQFTLDPLFHAGCYYPQEAGSMVLDSVLRQLDLTDAPKILDLCAAPGGKSTLIASFLGNKGLLVSNEVIQSRARILKENLTKWGYSNTVVSNNDPRDFERLPHFFDVIVADAPCSGEGMFRKDLASRDEWSTDNVQICAARQKRIVSDVWEALRPGGFFIYSTCTFNEQENEQNVLFMKEELGAEIVDIDLPSPIQQGRNEIGNYCIPGKTESEGFYIAVLKKAEGKEKNSKWTTKKDVRPIKSNEEIERFSQSEGIDFYQWNEKILALPYVEATAMMHVLSQLRIVKFGTLIGEMQRKGIQPHEELALNPFLLNYDQTIELDKDAALNFLRGDTFTLLGEVGYTIITHKGQALGWIKHLGNRFNNLYPKDWRIRMRP
jgi:16S rRNA C967 or C1407 C5-methylase (RsmB/RsmF family)/NOL1/NOP2/fmu family ribosome biogenesis protein